MERSIRKNTILPYLELAWLWDAVVWIEFYGLYGFHFYLTFEVLENNRLLRQRLTCAYRSTSRRLYKEGPSETLVWVAAAENRTNSTIQKLELLDLQK